MVSAMENWRAHWLVTKAVEGIYQNIVWIVLTVGGVLLWKFVKGDVTLPAWLLIIAIGVPAAAALLRRAGRATAAETRLSELGPNVDVGKTNAHADSLSRMGAGRVAFCPHVCFG
jgi:hypothetical protein